MRETNGNTSNTMQIMTIFKVQELQCEGKKKDTSYLTSTCASQSTADVQHNKLMDSLVPYS